MIQAIKDVVNTLTDPVISFSILFVTFFFIFPPNNWFMKLNKKLRIEKLWTAKGGIVFFGLLTGVLLFGIRFDETFRSVITKADNIPIVLLLYVMPFLTGLAMHQAVENDKRLANNEKPDE